MVETRSKIRERKMAKADSGVNKAAVQAYGEKASAVAQKMTLSDELYSGSPALQEAIRELKEEADRNKADAQKYREQQQYMHVDSGLLPEYAAQNERKTDANIKLEEETEDVGLFVSQPRGNSVIVANERDTDDPGDLMSWDELKSYSKDGTQGDHTVYGHLKGGLNRYYKVIGVGPPNAEKLQLIPSSEKTKNCLNDVRRHAIRRATDENGKVVTVKPVLQGVAWEIPNGHDDPLSLMDPRCWGAKKVEEKEEEKEEGKAEKTGGKNKPQRKRIPFTTLKIKWQIIDDDDDYDEDKARRSKKTKRFLENKTFETRSTLRSLIKQRPIPAPQDYKFGDRVLIKMGTIMQEADMWIYAGAIRSWDRYRQWEDGERPRENRSPTPDELMDVEEEL